MHSHRIRLAMVGAFCAAVGVARGQFEPLPLPSPEPIDTSTNDDARWGRIVQVIARVLDGSLGRPDFATAVSEAAWIAPFARNRAEAARLLPDRIPTNLRLISARASLFPSESAATDLVADLERNTLVPPSLLRKFKPDGADDATLRHANETMSRWLSHVLEAAPGTPVGVIALYDDGRRGIGPAEKPTLVFILVRGDFDVSGVPHVSRILYGTMDAALR
jgi:hypothetical protein